MDVHIRSESQTARVSVALEWWVYKWLYLAQNRKFSVDRSSQCTKKWTYSVSVVLHDQCSCRGVFCKVRLLSPLTEADVTICFCYCTVSMSHMQTNSGNVGQVLTESHHIS